MSTLLQDVRYGIRMLGKNPGFTAVAVLTLALGIGATTAIFSVVNAVLLRPLPYAHPERIVEITGVFRGKLQYSGHNSSGFEFWKSHHDPFQYLAASTGVGFNLAGAGRAERVRALRVSRDYFRVFGARPALGRDFLAEEDRLGGPNVVILSDGLWKRKLGGDFQAMGRTLTLDDTPYTIVGVMPAGFESLPPVDLWTTIGQVDRTIGSGWNYEVIGRLRSEVSRGQADGYLASLTQPFLSQFGQGLPPDMAKEMRFAAVPYRAVLTQDLRTPLWVLFGAIGLVLLIACVNVANLQMARAATRTREIALRVAMGAGRVRVFRQLLTENVLLALLGAAVGLFVAQWAVSFLVALTPTDLPRGEEIALDRWALGFTLLVAVGAGILFGLAPAFQITRTDLNEILKESAGRTTSRRRRLGAGLAVGEVALSLVLLVGSGLLVRTFVNLLYTDPGFDPRRVLSLQIWTTGRQYASGGALTNFYEDVVRRIENIPGVESASVVAAGLPLERGGNVGAQIAGRKEAEWYSLDYREITPEYFRTLGIPMLRGRLLTPADSESANKVTVVNAALARQYFPGGEPLGEHLRVEGSQYEIVGVVGDVKSYLDEPAPPTMFIPVAQAARDVDQLFQGWFPTCLLVRTGPDPLSLTHAVEEALRSVNPSVPVGQVRSMEQVLAVSLAKKRFLMTMMTIFAGLALVLAAVGLYGVISYSVSQRTHEIGVRMAVGATEEKVLALILRQGLALALLGTGIGLLAALGFSRLLGSELFGVKPTDPLTLAGVALLLLAVAFGASYFPARRATQVDPIVALRYE